MSQTPYYEDGPVTIYHGNSLEVLGALPFDSVDAVVMDPPYFLPAAHYSVRSGTFRSLSDLSMLEHFFRDVFTACARVLKPTGFLYAFCDGQSYPPFYATAFPHFKNIRPLIWDKQTSVNGYAWRHQHELIMFAAMADAPNVKTGDGDIIRARAVPINDRNHLAEKPESVLTRLIDKTTPDGGVVLDPFMGSGSTLRAARFLGKRCIGIEPAGARDAQPGGSMSDSHTVSLTCPVCGRPMLSAIERCSGGFLDTDHPANVEPITAAVPVRKESPMPEWPPCPYAHDEDNERFARSVETCGICRPGQMCSLHYGQMVGWG